MKIRQAKLDSDLDQIRECLVELQNFEKHLDSRMPAGEEIADAYIAEMLRKVDSTGGQVLVAETGNGLAGYATVLTKVTSTDLDDGDLEYSLIDDLFVKEQFRGNGIGKMLVRAAEHFAASAGSRWLRLSVLANNIRARRLYEELGFSELYIDFEKDLRGGG